MNENSIKVVTSNVQEYFKTNRLTSGDKIPLTGDYVKGDIVINIGVAQDVEPMWLCIESGSPGRWIVVGKVADIPKDLVDKVAGIGDLSGLVTEDKSSIVSAINETKSAAGNALTKADEAKTLASSNKTSILNLESELSGQRTELVNSVNEIVELIY